jgi:hypothetical protein
MIARKRKCRDYTPGHMKMEMFPSVIKTEITGR